MMHLIAIGYTAWCSTDGADADIAMVCMDIVGNTYVQVNCVCKAFKYIKS